MKKDKPKLAKKPNAPKPWKQYIESRVYTYQGQEFKLRVIETQDGGTLELLEAIGG